MMLHSWTTSTPVFHRGARLNNNIEIPMQQLYTIHDTELLHFNSLDLIRMMKEDLLNKRTEFKGSN